MRPHESPGGLRLPAAVRRVALTELGSDQFQSELAWMSWAGTVWRLAGNGKAVFVKRADDLEPERARLAWLFSRWPVPEVLSFHHALGDDWLVTREVAGVPLHQSSVGLEPAQKAVLLGEILRGLHAVDATGCPFGVRRPGSVLIHGDYCLPNVLVEGGRLSALIDVGQSGLGNCEDDLAAAVWSLQYNYGPGFAGLFLDAYGWPPMTDRAIERLRRRYAR